MNTKTAIAALSLLIAAPLMAAPKAKTAASDQTLTSGAYTATVKAIVCEGCAQFITETLNKNPSLEAISVDPKTKMLSFAVKKDAKVKVSDLQTALKASSDQMGMGADYSISNVKAVKK